MHQIIRRSSEEADDSSPSYLSFFFTCKPARDSLIRHYFGIIFLFPCPGVSAAWSAVCLWWNECFTNQYKPGQWQQQLKSYTLRAPNGLTLQFPPQREIGRTEVGIIKTTSPAKSGSPFFCFLPNTDSPILRPTRTFPPGNLPSSAALQMENLFSFDQSVLYLLPSLPLRGVIS